MKEILLTQGKIAIVDDCDFEELNHFKWFVFKDGNNLYACRNFRIGGKRFVLKMHRAILGLCCGDGKIVDHINHDGLDNRRENLRIVTKQQNQFNRKMHVLTKSSQFKGVYLHKPSSKWFAQIGINNMRINLGFFAFEKDAACAYDLAAKEHFGEFASLNFSS